MPTAPHIELRNFILDQERRLAAIHAMFENKLGMIISKKGNLSTAELIRNQDFKRAYTKAIIEFRSGLTKHIESQASQGWDLANKHNNNMVGRYLRGEKNVPTGILSLIDDQGKPAKAAFLKRKMGGLSLSERVWKYGGQYKQQIGRYLEEGIYRGLPAATIARDMKKLLKNPDARFRRVRDKKTGKLKLSKPMANYHPGRGVYRSAYKNSMRVARTEVNMAYHAADHYRRKKLFFVTGIEVLLSAQHPEYDICDHMAGKYPKNFFFMGWHPHCICYTKSLQMPKEDFRKYLRGEDVKIHNQQWIPERALNYVQGNADRIINAKTRPFWFDANMKYDRGDLLIPSTRDTAYSFIKTATTPTYGVPKVSPLVNPAEAGYHKLKKSDYKDYDDYDEYLDELEHRHNVKIDSEDSDYMGDYFKNWNNYDHNAYIDDINHALKKYGVESYEHRLTMHSADEFEFAYKLADKDGKYCGVVQRSFDSAVKRKNGKLVSDKNVNHDYFQLGKSHQGSGMSRDMFKVMNAHYEGMGIETINVHANIDVGGYTWGRYGFKLNDPEDLLEIWAEMQEAGAIHTLARAKKVVREFFRLNPGEKLPMNLLADMKGMKEHLLGSDWEGVINFSDKKQMQRYFDYMYR